MNREILQGFLGMSEMEEAVWYLLQKSEKDNIPFQNLSVNLSEFTKEGMFSTLLGFCHLLHREMLIPGYPNSSFYVGQKLIDVMRERRKCWKDMPDAMTFAEHTNNYFTIHLPSESAK